MKKLFKISIKKISYRLAASSAVIRNLNNKKQILLIKREHEPFKDLLCFPGGKVEDTENHLSASVRETNEETGINIKFPGINLLEVTYVRDYLIITTFATTEDMTNNNYRHNLIDCLWLTLEDVNKLEKELFAPNIKNLINKAFKLYETQLKL